MVQRAKNARQCPQKRLHGAKIRLYRDSKDRLGTARTNLEASSSRAAPIKTKNVVRPRSGAGS